MPPPHTLVEAAIVNIPHVLGLLGAVCLHTRYKCAISRNTVPNAAQRRGWDLACQQILFHPGLMPHAAELALIADMVRMEIQMRYFAPAAMKGRGHREIIAF